MLVTLIDNGDVRVVQWEQHPHTLTEWGPIQSKVGNGYLVAYDSRVLIDFCSCMNTILG